MGQRQKTQTPVSTSLIKVHEVDIVAGMSLMAIAINVAGGGQAIDDIEVRGQINDREVPLFSTTAHFTAPFNAPLLGCSGDLNAIAAGATGWLLMHCAAFSKIYVYAKCAGAGPTTITVDSSSDMLQR